jgi:hypothetical protein
MVDLTYQFFNIKGLGDHFIATILGRFGAAGNIS